jgi:hypothetical protein
VIYSHALRDSFQLRGHRRAAFARTVSTATTEARTVIRALPDIVVQAVVGAAVALVFILVQDKSLALLALLGKRAILWLRPVMTAQRVIAVREGRPR